MRRASAPRREKLAYEIVAAEANGARAPAQERFDNRDDGVAVRNQPSNDPVNDHPYDYRAKNRSTEA